jgi:hypothetical protein
MPNYIVPLDSFLLPIFVSNLKLIVDYLLSFWLNQLDYNFELTEIEEDHAEYATTINP